VCGHVGVDVHNGRLLPQRAARDIPFDPTLEIGRGCP
jgi:hypothetical protein